MAIIKIRVYQNNNEHSNAYKKFYGRVKHTTEIDPKTLCSHAAKDSGIEESDVATVFEALFKQIEELLCNGHPIRVDGLGTMKLGVTSSGVAESEVIAKYPKYDPEKEDVRKYLTARQVKGVHLLFVPCEEIKTHLRSVKFQTDKTEWEEYMKTERADSNENG